MTNMETCNRSPKWVRLLDSQDSPQTETNASSPNKQQKSHQSPIKAAEEALERAVELLPASLCKIILFYGKKIITCHGKLHNKQQIESAMETDKNYIPKSAIALDFKITISNTVMENTERIKFLQHMVNQAKKTYEKSLKDVVQECIVVLEIVLKINALKKQEREIILKMLYNVATATLTLSGSTCDPHLCINNLIELSPFLFQYVPETS